MRSIEPQEEREPKVMGVMDDGEVTPTIGPFVAW
jgi:hypothetical protein